MAQKIEKKQKSKRMIIISDLHCGSLWGLTPPSYQIDYDSKIKDISSALWQAYTTAVERFKPYDILLCNGDAIDGKGSRSGGTEQLVIDRNEQVKMAKICIDITDCDLKIFTHGTQYHTGSDGEDFEETLADMCNSKIFDTVNFEVSGWQVNARHHIGGSSVPHGRFTPSARSQLWDALVSAETGSKSADIIIRSHRHYYTQARYSKKIMITMPCLQAPFTKFGGRICEGIVNLGFVIIDFYDKNCSDEMLRTMPVVNEINFDSLFFMQKEVIKL